MSNSIDILFLYIFHPPLTEITFEEEIINKHVKLLVKDKETTSLTYGMYINSEGVATVAYKGDKKTLVVSNESVLNMDFHLVVY